MLSDPRNVAALSLGHEQSAGFLLIQLLAEQTELLSTIAIGGDCNMVTFD